MAKLLVVAVVVAFIVSLAYAAEEAGPSPVAKGGNAFAADLYARLKEQKGNLFFSPYSISSALAMTYAGARGDTAAQMAQVLHVDLAPDKLHAAYGALTGSLNAAGKAGYFELAIANALWAQKGYPFIPEYLALVEKAYAAKVLEADFQKDAEAARTTINRWVEDQTRDKIKDLIPPGVLNDLTRLVLTNAIYFKGNWVHQFKDNRTQDGPFTLLGGERVQAPMMHQTEHFGYLETEAFQALEMPYKGGALSMVVFLPKKADGLGDFEKSLTAENLESWIPKIAYEEVIVTFPKFKMTSAFSLGGPLAAMGMKDAFSGAADFSGMSTKERFFLQAALHKAFVDVNERGTEAAAATAIIVGATAMPPPPKPKPVFTADHPFLFLIRDTRSGAILFLGRVMNPKE